MLEKLKTELAAVILKIEAHNRSCEGHSGHALNPDNEIGGMRNRSAKRKRQIVERWSKDAQVAIELQNKKTDLENKILHIERAPQRDRRDMMALVYWDNLKAGDTFSIGNGPLVILKKNPYSLKTYSGTLWSMSEIIGLSRKRVDELRLLMNEDTQ